MHMNTPMAYLGYRLIQWTPILTFSYLCIRIRLKRPQHTLQLCLHLLPLGLRVGKHGDGASGSDPPRLHFICVLVLLLSMSMGGVHESTPDTHAPAATAADVEEADHAGVGASVTVFQLRQDFTGTLFRRASHAAGGEGVAEDAVAGGADDGFLVFG